MIPDHVTGFVPLPEELFAFIAIDVATDHEQRRFDRVRFEDVEDRLVALCGRELEGVGPVEVVHGDGELWRRRCTGDEREALDADGGKA